MNAKSQKNTDTNSAGSTDSTDSTDSTNSTDRSNPESETYSVDFLSLEPMVHKSYHEMSDYPVQERDAISQLQNNILLLYDLQSRFSFLMTEVRYLMKV